MNILEETKFILNRYKIKANKNLGQNFLIDENVINAIAVLITGVTGFIHLYYVSRPFNYLRGIMFFLLVIIFVYGVVFQNEFFVLKAINGQIGLIFFLLVMFSVYTYNTLIKVVDYLFNIKNSLLRKTKKSSL